MGVCKEADMQKIKTGGITFKGYGFTVLHFAIFTCKLEIYAVLLFSACFTNLCALLMFSPIRP